MVKRMVKCCIHYFCQKFSNIKFLTQFFQHKVDVPMLSVRVSCRVRFKVRFTLRMKFEVKLKPFNLKVKIGLEVKINVF